MQKVSAPFRVLLSDGRELTGVARFADFVRVEREWSGVSDEAHRMEAAMRVSYQVLIRTGQYEGSFEEFLDSVESYESEEDTSGKDGPGEVPSGS